MELVTLGTTNYLKTGSHAAPETFIDTRGYMLVVIVAMDFQALGLTPDIH
jgi:hypothetical protein